MREYALFATHNLTQKNTVNQEWIASLEAKSAAPHPVLEELNIKTELDKLTGRVNIVSGDSM